MAKKRGTISQPESEEGKEEQDHIMDEDKNGDEDVENDDDYEDDGEDDEEMGDGEEDSKEDSAANGKVGSPSPIAKDMQLRSGRRKRRRSRETTGLTPPDGCEQRKKRVRQETAKKVTKSSSDKGQEGQDESPGPSATVPTVAPLGSNGVDDNADVGSTLDSSSPQRSANPRRISFRSPQIAIGLTRKDGVEQVPEEQDDAMVPPQMGSTVVPGGKRKANGATRDHTSEFASDNGSAGTKTSDEVGFSTAAKSVLPEEATDLSTSELSAMEQQQQHLLSVFFMVSLALLYFVASPLMVQFAEVLVPLDVGLLPPRSPVIPVVPVEEEWLKTKGGDVYDVPKVEYIHEDPDVIEETVTEVVEPPSEEAKAWDNRFTDTLNEVEQLKEKFLLSKDTLSDKYIEWVDQIQKLRQEVSSRQDLVQARLLLLSDLEGALNQRIDDDHEDDDELWSVHQWARLRFLVQETVGKALLDSDSIVLWEMPDIDKDSCAAQANVGSIEVIEEPMMEKVEGGKSLLFVSMLEERESDLLLRAQMTADRFMDGGGSEQRIRGWIKAELDKTLKGNADVVRALSRLKEMASGIAVPENDNPTGSQDTSLVDAFEYLQEAIQHELEIDRADATGVYDHASLMNGATVLYGGKRGTSKSLIDDLPIVNRILQQSKFRFYGFGPEVALTPTYPRNALGQCWSFHQTTLEEQLEERALFQSDTGTPDDFKRGSFGTLTIRLPQPVQVESVTIEHPPMRLTDQSDSAIRSFRIVGYEDDRASSKAWNLGSFQYDIQKNRRNEYLQEFELSTIVFGKEVPALQSISLAVDSNWGHDYACLYRFRVHGDAAES